MGTTWKDLIQIDKTWVERHLNLHFSEPGTKTTIRLFTIRASGTTVSHGALCTELSEMVIPYVSGKTGLNQSEAVKAHSYAVKFFGEKNTQTDGKYGELLLFALVEAVLECKMVAHKIRTLSNFKDQVKGGDGIFLGEYLIAGENRNVYMIGESKVMAGYADAIDDALESINRFHDKDTAAEFNSTELIIAKDNLIIQEGADIDELYERLTPGTEPFRNQTLVHPVLLMYNTASIGTLEKKATDVLELEELIKNEITSRKARTLKLINEKVAKYDNIQKVYLDFFILPTNEVDAFRNGLYYEIHGVPYKPNEP